jgi:hypothetical protein
MFKQKIQELFKVIQTSVKQAIAGMNTFASANMDEVFPL